MNHVMIDLINVSKKPSSPLCAIEAVFLNLNRADRKGFLFFDRHS
jgi:hypothetical protein